jgi:glucose/arabinose dehydrogenase
MDRWLLFGVLSLVALLPVPASANADPVLPDGFSKVTVATGLWDATAFAYTRDGRVIIVEKRGRVAVAHPGVSQATKTLTDLTGHVAVDGDRGLLGVAVDPEFETNGYVYLLYTYDDGSELHAPKTSRLTRITVKPNDTVENPETVLLGSIGTAPCPQPDNAVDCIPSNSDSHSIGTVRAAADGTLWLGSGDGQKYNIADPLALRTFDETSMSGKILHIATVTGCRATRSARARPTSRRSARRSSPRASATRSASNCAAAPTRWSATSAGTRRRRST